MCVRIVFCLYAEDAGIFAFRNQFHDYLQEFDARHMRIAIRDLFKILNTKLEDREPYLEDDNPTLAKFPWVNGGLFEDDDIEIPPFADEIRELILVKSSENFNWSQISPTIFGAVFESTLNPETRRSGGMHYTSIENIHKVIDPLFLDELRAEFDDLKNMQTRRKDGSVNPIPYVKKMQYLEAFQDKLASLHFLDVGCGSGILSIVSLKLGAAHVTGTDIDEDCLTSTYENFAVNHLSREQGDFYEGNLIDDVKLQETVGVKPYDIAVANILADVIIPLAPVIPRFLKPGGLFIASGIIDFKENEVAAAIEAAGLTITEIAHQGEWVGITAIRE
ncbi:MAG: 50S ribosomal protein L11 methyltransferase [Clostridiales bacterium]|nr:50S ribosomal protein L11 methyltransferase [Clostridiales bacterium]